MDVRDEKEPAAALASDPLRRRKAVAEQRVKAALEAIQEAQGLISYAARRCRPSTGSAPRTSGSAGSTTERTGPGTSCVTRPGS